MMYNNFKTAFKNIKRQPLYSILSILAVSFGLTAVITLSMWIVNEKSYDKFHKDYEEIYRVVVNGKIGNLTINCAQTGSPLAKSLINNFPQVEKATRILKIGYVEGLNEEKNTMEINVLGVDSNFFSIFNVSFIQGESYKPLTNPNEAIITRETAFKFFGNEKAINKRIEFIIDGEKKNFIIKGIVDKFPEQSHFHFDVLFSLNSLNWTNNEQWLSTDFFTYILLKKNTDLENFQKKLNDYTAKMIVPEIKDWQNQSSGDVKSLGNYFNHDLQKLTDIHLHSNLSYEFEQNGNIVYIKLFYVLSLLLLIITISIFYNLTKVRLTKAHKEINVRRINGASKSKIFERFFTEIILLIFLSLLISFVLLEAFIPALQKYISISFQTSMIYNWNILFVSISIFVLVGFVVGLMTIPSFTRKNIPVITNSTKAGKNNKYNLFLIMQMMISIIVIFSTIIIRNQLYFMENYKLGMNKENIVTIRGISKINDKLDIFKKDILDNYDIKYASYSYTIPGKQFSEIACRKSDNSSESIVMSFCPCDFSFKDVFQLQIKEGRFFSDEFATDNRAIVINEIAAKKLKFRNPINEFLEFDGERFKIIGVVHDFHFDSKQKEIKPMALVIMPSVYSNWIPNYLSVKVNNSNLKSTINYLSSKWDKYANGNVFRYSFFDTDYDKLYSKETIAKRLLFIFSFLSIFIVVLGLISISLDNIQRRTKEIGIRKVNGATIMNIITFLNKSYVRMVVISLLIALPMAYFLMNNWLQNFAYRTDFNIMVFLITSIIILIVTLITISLQSYKAALQNPVVTLKSE